MKKVTLKDIAVVTGLSVNSVSRALKDKDSISAETRKMVQEAAKKMGYIPNSLASSMRSGKTYSIAVILGEIVNPYNAHLLNNLTTRLHDAGYTLLVFVTNQRRSLEDSAVQNAISKNVDALVACTQLKPDNMELIRGLGIPFLQIGLVSTTPEFCQVSKDEYHAGYLAARHLLEKGHRRILHIVFPQKYFAFSGERTRGFRQAYEEAGVPFDEGLLYTYYRENTIQRILEQAAEKSPGFTAITAGNDMLAWQVIETLRNQGFRVPEDYAVVGFDDLRSFIRVPYRLTSAASNLSDLSRRAVEILMAQLDDPQASPRVYVETTYLVEGEST
ncbi:MAG TPA: LacI family transcriptional regulator [Firmicutes bacterium]|nr:LacI family transcriptional regulator [Bacillota bacterium]